MNLNVDKTAHTCTTSIPSEEKSVEWIIKNIGALLCQKLPEIRFTFNAGESIGIPLTCNVSVNSYWDNDARFELQSNNEGPPVFVRLVCCINYNSEQVSSYEKNVFLKGSQYIGYFKIDPFAKNDVMSLHLEITIYGREAITEVHPNQSEIRALSERETVQKNGEDMHLLLDSGYNSDFVIKVLADPERSEYESFYVHKAILAARSEVFRVMFETPMKESQSGEVILDGLSPAALKIVLKFIYTGIVDDGWKSNPSEILDVADRYLLSSLKKFIDVNLLFICDVENAYDMFRMAKHQGLGTATKNISKYMQQILN